MKGKRLKIHKLFYALTALFLIIAVAVTIAGNLLTDVLDSYAGMGEVVVKTKPGTENWDADYYSTDFATAEEIDAHAKDTTKKIAGEGITLLKNENQVLPLKTSATGEQDKNISVFGRRSVDTVWGGTGSGAGDAGQCTSIADAFTAAGYNVNGALTKMYSDNLDNVEAAVTSMDKLSTMTYYIGEFPQNYYDSGITSTYADYHDAAIVVFGRTGGEGMDFCTNLKESITSGLTGMSDSVAETKNYEDGQHELELSYEEKELLAHVEANFDKVIVVINSANVMELGELQDDENVDAIVWMAYPGSRGTVALAEILNGTINPSGHTVDTWPRDLTKDPTFPNTTVSEYVNVSEENAREKSYMVEYEEGIYFGYRYYETAAAEGYIDFDEAVVYPFGYGLSYTTFAQEIKDVAVKDGVITISVNVTNTGSVAGKDVVQVYVKAPYTGAIEKAEQVLVGYAKSPLLEAGESQTVEITFTEESMASYDYKNEGCYVLDAGDYVLTVRKNSHEVYGENCEYVHNVASAIVYNEDNPRQTEIEAQTGEYVNYSEEAKAEMTVLAAVNQFDEESAHFVEYTDANANNGYGTNFTRESFAASFPTTPTAADLTANEKVIADLGEYNLTYYDSNDVMPTTGASNGVYAAALRGRTYDDPLWEDLLDQITVKEMANLIYAGNQGSIAVNSIGLPAATGTDGPAGLKQYGGLGLGVSGNFNCCGTLVAATWNVELAEEYGIAVGNEAVQAGLDIWYAPGTNIHRTAFGGRNFEYYSEDPLVSGQTCAGTIQGCSTKGLVCYFKHFFLNEVETHREDNAPCVWANEQAIREIYLKAFEIAIKEPAVELKYLDEEGNAMYKTIRSSMGLMTSFTRVGSTWTGASVELLANVLRGEWGFMGAICTDYNDEPQMDVEAAVYAGNDIMLANAATLPTEFRDLKNPSTVIAMRKATKNIIYSVVNSNGANGLSDSTVVTYKMAPWKKLMYGLDAVLVILAVVMLILGKRRVKKIQLL